jgi:signal transduction histidine kinase
MKKLCLLLLIALCLNCYAQDRAADSLRKAAKAAKTDSARCLSALALGTHFIEINRDTALYYADKALVIAKKNSQWFEEASALNLKAHQLNFLKKFPEALVCLQQAFKLADDPENRDKKTWSASTKYPPARLRFSVLASSHVQMGILMSSTGDPVQEIGHYRAAAGLAEKGDDKIMLAIANMALGARSSNPDSSLLFEKKAELNFKLSGDTYYLGYVYSILAWIHLGKGNPKLFLQYFHQAAATDLKNYNLSSLSEDHAAIAEYYLRQKQPDSSLYYSKKTLEFFHTVGAKELGYTYERLYKSYELKHQTDSAYKYLGLALTAKNSTYEATIKSLTDFQKLSMKDQLRLQALEKEKEQTQSRTRTSILLAAIGVFMLLAIIFWRNNRQKQKANHLLSEQKEEIETQRDNLGQALEELKNTQTQLIQSEKMASLGELTAGIAHEIQNPLNFVNNFSEVSAELVGEMEEELDKGDVEEAKTIAGDVKQNLEKIRYHGQRADAIVKGMLQHSQAGSGTKELTNINALADEYMRLAYHGLRSKDKSFNAELVTQLDAGLPKVNVIPQDIGRVLLNLFNNAFYAVNQKTKAAGEDYKPEVSVSTSAENGQVIIKVKDNGVGIPDAIKEKIMQPFFTTKPTGEGTGLGLSLTYDMVVKGHGGTIQVNSKEGEGSEFIITLPIG